MKAITPNPVWRVGVLDMIELPCGTLVAVRPEDFTKHALGLYRWYRGARGAVVASYGADRRTVYLARLLAGALVGERLCMIERVPAPHSFVTALVLDYTPSNFRRLST